MRIGTVIRLTDQIERPEKQKNLNQQEADIAIAARSENGLENTRQDYARRN